MEHAPPQEQLSTPKFIQELCNIDFISDPTPRLFKHVALNPELFLSEIARSRKLSVVPSSDGPVSHVRESASKEDNSRSSGYFGLHTDGQYLPKVPNLVILHCKKRGEGKTPSIFADSEQIIRILQERGKLEYAMRFNFVFKNKDGKDFIRPLIERHSETGNPVMNVAFGSDKCRLISKGISENEAAAFYQEISTIADSIPKVAFQWDEGDTLVFDNERMLHGRGISEEETKSDATRHLYRIWLKKK